MQRRLGCAQFLRLKNIYRPALNIVVVCLLVGIASAQNAEEAVSEAGDVGNTIIGDGEKEPTSALVGFHVGPDGREVMTVTWESAEYVSLRYRIGAAVVLGSGIIVMLVSEFFPRLLLSEGGGGGQLLGPGVARNFTFVYALQLFALSFRLSGPSNPFPASFTRMLRGLMWSTFILDPIGGADRFDVSSECSAVNDIMVGTIGVCLLSGAAVLIIQALLVACAIVCHFFEKKPPTDNDIEQQLGDPLFSGGLRSARRRSSFLAGFTRRNSHSSVESRQPIEKSLDNASAADSPELQAQRASSQQEDGHVQGLSISAVMQNMLSAANSLSGALRGRGGVGPWASRARGFAFGRWLVAGAKVQIIGLSYAAGAGLWSDCGGAIVGGVFMVTGLLIYWIVVIGIGLHQWRAAAVYRKFEALEWWDTRLHLLRGVRKRAVHRWWRPAADYIPSFCLRYVNYLGISERQKQALKLGVLVDSQKSSAEATDMTNDDSVATSSQPIFKAKKALKRVAATWWSGIVTDSQISLRSVPEFKLKHHFVDWQGIEGGPSFSAEGTVFSVPFLNVLASQFNTFRWFLLTDSFQGIWVCRRPRLPRALEYALLHRLMGDRNRQGAELRRKLTMPGRVSAFAVAGSTGPESSFVEYEIGAMLDEVWKPGHGRWVVAAGDVDLGMQNRYEPLVSHFHRSHPALVLPFSVLRDMLIGLALSSNRVGIRVWGTGFLHFVSFAWLILRAPYRSKHRNLAESLLELGFTLVSVAAAGAFHDISSSDTAATSVLFLAVLSVGFTALFRILDIADLLGLVSTPIILAFGLVSKFCSRFGLHCCLMTWSSSRSKESTDKGCFSPKTNLRFISVQKHQSEVEADESIIRSQAMQNKNLQVRPLSNEKLFAHPRTSESIKTHVSRQKEIGPKTLVFKPSESENSQNPNNASAAMRRSHRSNALAGKRAIKRRVLMSVMRRIAPHLDPSKFDLESAEYWKKAPNSKEDLGLNVREKSQEFHGDLWSPRRIHMDEVHSRKQSAVQSDVSSKKKSDKQLQKEKHQRKIEAEASMVSLSDVEAAVEVTKLNFSQKSKLHRRKKSATSLSSLSVPTGATDSRLRQTDEQAVDGRRPGLSGRLTKQDVAMWKRFEGLVRKRADSIQSNHGLLSRPHTQQSLPVTIPVRPPLSERSNLSTQRDPAFVDDRLPLWLQRQSSGGKQSKSAPRGHSAFQRKASATKGKNSAVSSASSSSLTVSNRVRISDWAASTLSRSIDDRILADQYQRDTKSKTPSSLHQGLVSHPSNIGLDYESVGAASQFWSNMAPETNISNESYIPSAVIPTNPLNSPQPVSIRTIPESESTSISGLKNVKVGSRSPVDLVPFSSSFSDHQPAVKTFSGIQPAKYQSERQMISNASISADNVVNNPFWRPFLSSHQTSRSGTDNVQHLPKAESSISHRTSPVYPWQDCIVSHQGVQTTAHMAPAEQSGIQPSTASAVSRSTAQLHVVRDGAPRSPGQLATPDQYVRRAKQLEERPPAPPSHPAALTFRNFDSSAKVASTHLSSTASPLGVHSGISLSHGVSSHVGQLTTNERGRVRNVSSVHSPNSRDEFSAAFLASRNNHAGVVLSSPDPAAQGIF